MSPDARSCLKCPFLWPHLESEGFKNSEMTKYSFSNNGFTLAYVNEQRPEKSQKRLISPVRYLKIITAENRQKRKS